MDKSTPFTPVEELTVALRLLTKVTRVAKSLRLRSDEAEQIYSYCSGAADCIRTAQASLQNGTHPYLREENAE